MVCGPSSGMKHGIVFLWAKGSEKSLLCKGNNTYFSLLCLPWLMWWVISKQRVKACFVMQNVIINTSRGCYLNTNLSRRAVRGANSFEGASLVNK